ncbi:ferrous iron transport protein A [Anaerosolibacter carboniphilus]|uniref:Ferrous iron transport protein A n=1 Tax=Anaerosolibacter carboniphilus TaxID=1417629 RepID=A0A841KT67_9FIRM|nr:FeoA family protein [Anaerosolibacter carboniphilus]MBB6216786.1 ferrous iron transport protein A [Anaerosolibacter carboniphilus]
MEKTLKDLKPGESGIISMIKGKGPGKRRLMDMGVIKGTAILVEKVAPLGDPIEVKVKGYNLSFRREDAENIVIE